MNHAITQIENQVGPNTKYHLFLYQRIASLQLIMQDLDAVENTFFKQIEVAEKTRDRLKS